jgi:protein tyrosine phosphatase (PTP) superfamily phosphohydrolase (DUF442 family)
MSTPSSENAGKELNTDPEAPRFSLLGEIDAIEELLDSLKGSESDSLRSELQDKTKTLESLNENELSSYKFRILLRDVDKIKKKAEELAASPLQAMRSRILEQIGNIARILRPLKDNESDPSRPEQEEIRKNVTSLETEIENQKVRVDSLTEKDLPSVQKDIDQIKEKADALATRSFLAHEIGLIGNLLGSTRVGFLKRRQLDLLRSEIDDRRQKLASLQDNELSAFRQDLTKIREGAETLIIQPSFAPRLRSMSALIWIGLIPFILLVYIVYFALWQQVNKVDIHATATVYAATYPSPTLIETAIPAVTLTAVTQAP